MRKNLEKAETLSALADRAAFSLPENVRPHTKVNGLETDYAFAGPGMLTFMTEKAPGKLYRVTASVILVPKELGKIMPRDESVQVVPVANPAEVFDRIWKAF